MHEIIEIRIVQCIQSVLLIYISAALFLPKGKK